MIRWLLVFATVFAMGAAMWSIRGYRGDRSAADEILAYELSSPGGVTTLVAGGTKEIVLTSWLVMPPQSKHNPFERYGYELSVQLGVGAGTPLIERRFELTSRISGDPQEPLSSGEFAARLADSDDWVTDGRTTRLNTAELGNRAAKLRVWAPGGAAGRVLVRLSYEEARGDIARAILERTLLPEQRRRMVSKASALGFDDLPATERLRVLATWGRRLTAEGRSGRDFRVQRLLIGDFRAELEDEEEPAGLEVGPGLKAAINFKGPAELDVEGSPGSAVFLEEDATVARSERLGSSGRVRFTLPGQGPRSALIWTENPSRLRFMLGQEARGQLLGKPGVEPRGDRVEVTPDYRFQRFWQLAKDDPIRYDLAEGQDRVGVTVRGLAARDAIEAPIRVTVHWEGNVETTDSDEVVTALPLSGLASTPTLSVSEPVRFVLLPPPGATAVSFTGSPSSAIAVWTLEPFVSASKTDPAYPEQLGDGREWQDAPSEQRATATLLPTRALGLLKTDRALSVKIQPHIQKAQQSLGPRIVDRVIRPSHPATTRRLYRNSWHAAGTVFPENAWHWLPSDEPRGVRVAGEGPRAGRIPLVYRTCSEQLGELLRVTVDGAVVRERRLRTTSGSLLVQASPGPHELRVLGAGACGTVLVGVAPASSGTVLKAQLVHELTRERPLHLPFTRRPGELTSIILLVTSEETPALYALRFAIDPGRETPRRGVFLQRITEHQGNLQGTTAGQERASLWEAGNPIDPRHPTDFVARSRIALGDDLAEGKHELVLRSASTRPLWVRAVLVGRILQHPGRTQ